MATNTQMGDLMPPNNGILNVSKIILICMYNNMYICIHIILPMLLNLHNKIHALLLLYR